MLLRHGYGVLLFDRRGEGESDGDPNAFGWAADKDIEAAVALPPTPPRRRPQPDRRHRPLRRRRDAPPGGRRIRRPQGGRRRRRRRPLAPGGPGPHRQRQVGRDPDLRSSSPRDDALRQPGAAAEPEEPRRPHRARDRSSSSTASTTRTTSASSPPATTRPPASRRRSGRSPAPRTPAASTPSRASTSSRVIAFFDRSLRPKPMQRLREAYDRTARGRLSPPSHLRAESPLNLR